MICNPNGILENLVAECRASPAVDQAVDFQLDLAVDLPDVSLDADRLRQLFLGLIKNSVQAMGNGGVIRISTSPWRRGPAVSHIEISIEDTGPGLPEGVFWNLYRSVSSASGEADEGLELAVVGQLLRDLGGLINCRTDSKGTRFLVLLPLTKDARSPQMLDFCT